MEQYKKLMNLLHTLPEESHRENQVGGLVTPSNQGESNLSSIVSNKDMSVSIMNNLQVKPSHA